VATAFTAFAALMIMLFLFYQTFAGTTEYHVHDWRTFYESRASHHFKVPNEAVIRHCEQREQLFGYHLLIRLTLPETKSPAAWVKTIAEDSGIGKYRKSDLLYDSGGDVYKVEYVPEEGLYELRVIID
jgi:hypothetical protein